MSCVIYLFAMLCLAGIFAVQANPVPEVKEGGNKSVNELLHAYTETNDTYTAPSSRSWRRSMPMQKGRKEDSEEDSEPEHNINKRALGCAQTSVAYGSTTGTAFADFTGTNPWPCGADITEIRVHHGSLIDGIQVTYRTFDGRTILKPLRGGSGGTESTVRLQEGERITGVTGTVCTDIVRDNYVYMAQLVFFAEKQDGQKVIYGPYGYARPYNRQCTMFAVNGKITSIFGRALTLSRLNYTGLGAIGFYYEDA